MECKSVKKTLKEIGPGLYFFMKIYKNLMCISKANRKNYNLFQNQKIKTIAELRKILKLESSTTTNSNDNSILVLQNKDGLNY